MKVEHRASSHCPERIEADLAPGDARSSALDWSELCVERVGSPEDPLFRAAYDRLRQEFGARGELEREAVLASRLRWDPAEPTRDHVMPVDLHDAPRFALLYEMLVVRRGPGIVGLRDHTAIVSLARKARDGPGSILVHLSHMLVEPALRGSGLAGWLRALPIQTARECAARAEASIDLPITLVAEMEAHDPADPATAARLRSYGRAGFLAIDPSATGYCQPDFRDEKEIDRTCLQPVPLTLVVRRVGREREQFIAAREVRGIIAALYTMYGAHIRAEHMAPLWAKLDRFPDDTPHDLPDDTPHDQPDDQPDIALEYPLPT